jgi:Fe-S-cluster containining protein
MRMRKRRSRSFKVKAKRPGDEEFDCRRCGLCCVSWEDQEAYCDISAKDLRRLSPSWASRNVYDFAVMERVVAELEGRQSLPIAALKTASREQKTGPLKGCEVCACVALRGSLLHQTYCSIYERRPDACREAVKPGDRSCREIRALARDFISDAQSDEREEEPPKPELGWRVTSIPRPGPWNYVTACAYERVLVDDGIWRWKKAYEIGRHRRSQRLAEQDGERSGLPKLNSATTHGTLALRPNDFLPKKYDALYRLDAVDFEYTYEGPSSARILKLFWEEEFVAQFGAMTESVMEGLLSYLFGEGIVQGRSSRRER